ncbi:MAG: 16S rRNA (adenine(1518)-N(6)/adenine(1519)-N(6))-dimethyltransferase RsmA [Candidatus Omnitrophica bacterium]|nr:16S rRNA (adenine(1518)-N(6)/adenine(1519)-N(6))-dimethyltransferase RsmA [Candidatus Omnitrophota bacterium]MDD5355904.1 16S rRNA (adenine(1518)-N(6)/adenine(1519)-N(6))-dimethyltransferase RsmA [Candidatus Omnitrophota bacterium]
MPSLPLNFHSKKRFGQNFLTDKNILSKILKSISVSEDDVILEIGPGKGILTRGLLPWADKVIAVELDKYLYGYLKTDLGDFNNLELINSDILEFDLRGFLKKINVKHKIKLTGNIPYNITSPILEYVFSNINLIDSVYIMVQKEFALRLVARPNTKDYSSISCFVQFHMEPTLLFTVKRTCFSPKPKVDSCFVRLLPRQLRLKPKDNDLLFKVIRNAFNQRRKNVLNSLSTLLDKGEVTDILAKLRLNSNLRAENLSLEDYIRISNAFFDCNNFSHPVL